MRTLAFARGIFIYPEEKPPAANAGKRAYGDRPRKSEFVIVGRRGRGRVIRIDDERELPFPRKLRSDVFLLPGRNNPSALGNTILPPRSGQPLPHQSKSAPFPSPRLVLYDDFFEARVPARPMIREQPAPRRRRVNQETGNGRDSS